MRTVLDDQAIEPQPATLRAALGLVRDRAEEAGRIIIEAHGDGAPLPDEYLAEPPEGDAGFAELRFTSVSRGAFLSETLRDAVDAVELAGQKQGEAAEAIATGRQPDASRLLAELLEIWEAVRSVALQAGRLMEVDPGEVDVPEADGRGPLSGAACVESLRSALEELRVSVTDGDWTAAGDVLEGELAEAGEDWRRLLGAMAGMAQKG